MLIYLVVGCDLTKGGKRQHSTIDSTRISPFTVAKR